jgi:hypothetical protein
MRGSGLRGRYEMVQEIMLFCDACSMPLEYCLRFRQPVCKICDCDYCDKAGCMGREFLRESPRVKLLIESR